MNVKNFFYVENLEQASNQVQTKNIWPSKRKTRNIMNNQLK